MTSAFKGAVGAAALLLAVGGTAQAATTFVASGVTANGHATAASGSTTSLGDGSDSDSLSASGDEDASALATAGAFKKTLLADSQAIEDASASFANASSGTIDFSGHSFADSFTSVGTATATNTGSSFFYTFSIDYKSWLTINYDLTESALATQFYNAGSLYDVSTSTSFGLVGGTGVGNTSGTLSQYLDPGTYTLYLNTSNGDYASSSGIASASGSHSEHYDFEISAAPEPGLWALMLSSVGLAGLMLRRRRAAPVLAG